MFLVLLAAVSATDPIMAFLDVPVRIFLANSNHEFLVKNTSSDTLEHVSKYVVPERIYSSFIISRDSEKYVIKSAPSYVCVSTRGNDRHEVGICNHRKDYWKLIPQVIGYKISTDDNQCLTFETEGKVSLRSCSSDKDQVFDFRIAAEDDKCDDNHHHDPNPRSINLEVGLYQDVHHENGDSKMRAAPERDPHYEERPVASVVAPPVRPHMDPCDAEECLHGACRGCPAHIPSHPPRSVPVARSRVVETVERTPVEPERERVHHTAPKRRFPTQDEPMWSNQEEHHAPPKRRLVAQDEPMWSNQEEHHSPPKRRLVAQDEPAGPDYEADHEDNHGHSSGHRPRRRHHRVKRRNTSRLIRLPEEETESSDGDSSDYLQSDDEDSDDALYSDSRPAPMPMHVVEKKTSEIFQPLEFSQSATPVHSPGSDFHGDNRSSRHLLHRFS